MFPKYRDKLSEVYPKETPSEQLRISFKEAGINLLTFIYGNKMPVRPPARLSHSGGVIPVRTGTGGRAGKTYQSAWHVKLN